ncbi:unnamed protein product (mitochondrion) [Plasmodiophora brassicae]|uniref:G-protein coupled receptors family 3 profile domain-containing protein n=1 Tax=Plasmodiophora brassicae TaxID=37360 RepID=A0A0G4J3I0_PLABS|nr:hypothetical protein PBRA_002204 [Plasmodiophora brassicae]SPQ98801.1 unnamed protein product [Plasmodiophora brassicae]
MSWLTTWANLQVAVLLAALAAFTTMRYTHAPRSAFPVVLSGVNLATAVATLLLTVAEAVEPTVCAFFMHEALFALSDYNLYHARMAIFYQSSARASRWLKAALYAQNVLFVTLSIINLVSGDTPKRFGFSCISGSSGYSLAIGVPVFVNFAGMFVIGVYTVRRFARDTNAQATRNLAVLTLMLMSFAMTALTGIAIIVFAALRVSHVLTLILQLATKTVAIGLAGTVWVRIRRHRDATKLPKAGSGRPPPVRITKASNALDAVGVTAGQRVATVSADKGNQRVDNSGTLRKGSGRTLGTANREPFRVAGGVGGGPRRSSDLDPCVTREAVAGATVAPSRRVKSAWTRRGQTTSAMAGSRRDDNDIYDLDVP